MIARIFWLKNFTAGAALLALALACATAMGLAWLIVQVIS